MVLKALFFRTNNMPLPEMRCSGSGMNSEAGYPKVVVMNVLLLILGARAMWMTPKPSATGKRP